MQSHLGTPSLDVGWETIVWSTPLVASLKHFIWSFQNTNSNQIDMCLWCFCLQNNSKINVPREIHGSQRKVGLFFFFFQRGCSGETIRKISREALYNPFLALALPCPTVMIMGLIIGFFYLYKCLSADSRKQNLNIELYNSSKYLSVWVYMQICGSHLNTSVDLFYHLITLNVYAIFIIRREIRKKDRIREWRVKMEIKCPGFPFR